MVFWTPKVVAKGHRAGAVNTSRVPRPTDPDRYGQITSRTSTSRTHPLTFWTPEKYLFLITFV